MKSRLNVLLMLSALAGCRQDMHNQPKYKPLQKSDFFADGRSARPLPVGVIARGHLNDTQPQFTGMDNGRFLEAMPVPVTRDMLARGRERYDIFCSPCHGRLGDGNGMVALRGFRAPPSLLTDRVRREPAGYIYAVISNGFGGMPDYSSQIEPVDRWAVVAYLRALELAQSATIADVPPEQRGELR